VEVHVRIYEERSLAPKARRHSGKIAYLRVPVLALLPSQVDSLESRPEPPVA
jgi:hypothetical protein